MMRTRSPCSDLDGGAGGGAVVAPEIEDFAGEDFLFYRLGDQVEDFDAVVELEGEIGDVGSLDWKIFLRGNAALRARRGLCWAGFGEGAGA